MKRLPEGFVTRGNDFGSDENLRLITFGQLKNLIPLFDSGALVFPDVKRIQEHRGCICKTLAAVINASLLPSSTCFCNAIDQRSHRENVTIPSLNFVRNTATNAFFVKAAAILVSILVGIESPYRSLALGLYLSACWNKLRSEDKSFRDFLVLLFQSGSPDITHWRPVIKSLDQGNYWLMLCRKQANNGVLPQKLLGFSIERRKNPDVLRRYTSYFTSTLRAGAILGPKAVNAFLQYNATHLSLNALLQRLSLGDTTTGV
jgi:hypothetical protein